MPTVAKKTAPKTAPKLDRIEAAPIVTPGDEDAEMLADAARGSGDSVADAGAPTPEELEAVATFGVSLDTLRAIRAQAAADVNAAVDAAGPGQDYDPHAGICGACHPNGWPTPHADYSECEHGTFTRHGYERKGA